jgi:hypothetical protein
MLNALITAFDIFLYVKGDAADSNINHATTFFLGAVQSSINIIYLFLLPMLIAKQHSEEMANIGEFQRVSYAGTIVGVVIALCAVGKYLFSDNLASLLDYWTKNDPDIDPPRVVWKGWRDIITSLLQLVSLLII